MIDNYINSYLYIYLFRNIIPYTLYLSSLELSFFQMSCLLNVPSKKSMNCFFNKMSKYKL